VFRPILHLLLSGVRPRRGGPRHGFKWVGCHFSVFSLQTGSFYRIKQREWAQNQTRTLPPPPPKKNSARIDRHSFRENWVYKIGTQVLWTGREASNAERIKFVFQH
jgi:hypothetical protein